MSEKFLPKRDPRDLVAPDAVWQSPRMRGEPQSPLETHDDTQKQIDEFRNCLNGKDGFSYEDISFRLANIYTDAFALGLNALATYQELAILTTEILTSACAETLTTWQKEQLKMNRAFYKRRSQRFVPREIE